jgi:hypothetical protein
VYLTGYFDDSGSDDGSPVMTIGGILGPPQPWPEFCKDWRAVLAEGVEFHAADLEFNGDSGSPLSKLPRDEKAEIKRNLLDVISKYGLRGMSVSLDTKNFWEARETTLGKVVPYPYFLCALKCFWAIHRIIMGEAGSDVRVWFDEHDKVKGRMETVFENIQNIPEFARFYRVHRPEFKPSRKHPELQAADLVAHASNQHFRYLLRMDPNAIERLRENEKSEYENISPLARPTTMRLAQYMYLFNYATGPSLGKLIEGLEPYLKEAFPELYPSKDLVECKQ